MTRQRPAGTPRGRGAQTSPAGPGIAGGRGPHPARPSVPPRAVERVLQRRADLRADALGFVLAVLAFGGVLALLVTGLAWIGGAL